MSFWKAQLERKLAAKKAAGMTYEAGLEWIAAQGWMIPARKPMARKLWRKMNEETKDEEE